MLEHVLLAVSVMLNLVLWRRLHRGGRIPQHAIDRINDLRTQLDLAQAKLRATQNP